MTPSSVIRPVGRRGRTAGLLAAAALVALAGGCATSPVPPAPPIVPGTAADAFAARSLDDPGLKRFLTDNLGRVPEGNAWDFEALCWVAFYYHPSLELARAQWAVTRATQRTAAERPNPTLTLTPGYNFTADPGVSPWLPAINLDFLFPNSAKRLRQQDIARADAENARLSVLVAAWQARSDLRAALAALATANRRHTLLEVQAEVQKKVLDLVVARHAAGAIPPTEVATARIAFVKAQSAALDATAQRDNARVQLATALGLPLSAISALPPVVPTVAPAMNSETLATARRESLQSRADILAALAHYESTRAALALEIQKQVPDFHLGPGYQWDQGGNKWTLAFTTELPIFHRNESAIGEANARSRVAAAEFTAKQAQAIAAIDTAATANATALVQLEHAHQVEELLRAQGATVQKRLDAGGADQLEVETAHLETATADLDLAAAENAADLAAGQLEDALQVPFPHLAALTPVDAANPSRSP